MIKILIRFYRSSCSIHWKNKEKLHRLDGPAIIYSGGAKEWFKEGKRHRDDGPAIIYSDGAKRWYKDGEAWGNDLRLISTGHRIEGT